jgi:rhomboid family protein
MVNPYRHLSIFGLIALCAGVFAVEQINHTSWSKDYGTVPALVVPALRAFVHGDFSLATIRELSRLVSSLFLHGDPEHIIYNMVFLWAFGYLTSQLLGQWYALGVFLLTGVCGNLLQAFLHVDSIAPIIGASGAICGFEGVYFGLALQWQLPWADVWPLAYRVPPAQLGVFAVLGFLADIYFLGDRSQHIAFGAHAGGFICGVVIAAIVATISHAGGVRAQPA